MNASSAGGVRNGRSNKVRYRSRMPTLLIADDSEAKLMLLKSLVRHAHWSGNVLIAETTAEAMRLIAEHDIGFAFIDYYIPSENGPAIILALKAKRPDAHCILVSSSDQQKNIDAAALAGAEGFVCTSWEGDRAERELLEILEQWKTLQ